MGQYISTGDITSTIASVVDIAGTAQLVASDPAIGEVVCLAKQLSKISQGYDPGPACVHAVITPENTDKGLGLKSALPAVRLFVWIRENPVLASLVGVGAFGAIWGWGFTAGKRRRL